MPNRDTNTCWTSTSSNLQDIIFKPALGHIFSTMIIDNLKHDDEFETMDTFLKQWTSPTWIDCNYTTVTIADLPSSKTPPRIKHEVDRFTYGRDMAIWNFQDGGRLLS